MYCVVDDIREINAMDFPQRYGQVGKHAFHINVVLMSGESS